MAVIKPTPANSAERLTPTSLFPAAGWRATYSPPGEVDLFAWALLPKGELVGLVWNSGALVSAEGVQGFQGYSQ